MLSVSHQELHVKGAIDAGVDGYLLKETNTDEIVKAIRKLMNGETYYAQKVTKTLIKSQQTAKTSTKVVLTNRETEVLRFLSEGYSTVKIARELFISTNTVSTHRKSLLKKFNAKKNHSAY